MGKKISIFIDESGDFGFIKDASKYYIVTLVFHYQEIDISDNINKMKKYPVFHAGPLIRREYPFDNTDIIERKKLFQSMFMFVLGLPIECKSFIYEKKDFDQDLLKMHRKMVRDLYTFLMNLEEKINDYQIMVYYDNGQHSLTKILNSVLALTPYNFEFKKEVYPINYRLIQVADFISTVRLLEYKMNKKEMSSSERKFIDERYLKKNYIKGINKKEINY